VAIWLKNAWREGHEGHEGHEAWDLPKQERCNKRIVSRAAMLMRVMISKSTASAASEPRSLEHSVGPTSRRKRIAKRMTERQYKGEANWSGGHCKTDATGSMRDSRSCRFDTQTSSWGFREADPSHLSSHLPSAQDASARNGVLTSLTWKVVDNVASGASKSIPASVHF
jgi:hypothetical protein